MSHSWYFFMGGDDPYNPANYIRITPNKYMCLCGDTICAVYAKGVHHKPEEPFTTNLKTYISTALVTKQLQPDMPALSRKYVYLKDY